jgi:hypothetical protein
MTIEHEEFAEWPAPDEIRQAAWPLAELILAIVAISGGTEGTKNPHEPGREPEPIRRFPFAPQGNALAHIQPASSSSRPRYSPTRISLTGLSWRGTARKELRLIRGRQIFLMISIIVE